MYTIPSNKRNPTDLTIGAHDWLNNGFKKVYGDKVRSNAVFCVKNKNIAYGYGDIYVIYPKDGFRFYYSNEIEDIYTKKSGVTNLDFVTDIDISIAYMLYLLYSINNSYHALKLETSKIYADILKDKFGEYNYKNAKKYIKYIEKKYPDSVEKFIKRYYKKSTDLNDVKNLGSNNEIMVICKGYYSVREE